MKRSEIFRQWLAVRVVALMRPEMPVKTIQAWSDRQLLDHFEAPKPGKNVPRLYSFVNAVQLHAMYVTVNDGGTSVKTAVKVGQAAVKRFLVRFEDGDRTFDEPWLSLVFWMGHEDRLNELYMTSDDMAGCLKSHGLLAPPQQYPGRYGSVIAMDELIHALWSDYQEIDEKFNADALAGKLKPFPEELERKSSKE